MVERFFRDLTVNRLRQGSFHSVGDLIAAIEESSSHSAWQAVVALRPCDELGE